MNIISGLFGSSGLMGMGGAQQHYGQFYGGTGYQQGSGYQPAGHHKGSLTHEGERYPVFWLGASDLICALALAAAAGFAAMHQYEAHMRATGKPVNHGVMKVSLRGYCATVAAY